MRIPSFTAEASLSRAEEAYQMTVMPAPTSGVTPQFCFSNEGGTTCCQCYYGWCWCHRILPHVLQ